MYKTLIFRIKSSSFSDLVKFAWNRWAVRWGIISLVAVLFFLFFIPFVPKLNGPSLIVTRWDQKKSKIDVEVGPEVPGWTTSNQVSKHLLHAIVVAEDSRFYQHLGLDFGEIFESLQLNLARNRYVRGGSTITQQVVKMAFLSREKTLTRKVREAFGALWLEMIMPKDKILEWYMNLAEFGAGVYGVRAAAQHYFQTSPELLTIEQATHLALVLPSPTKWGTGLKKRRLSDFGKRRFHVIAQRMNIVGYITDEQLTYALRTGDFGRPIDDKIKVLTEETMIATDAKRDRESKQSLVVAKEELEAESSQAQSEEIKAPDSSELEETAP